MSRLSLWTAALSIATLVVVLVFANVARRNVAQTRSLRDETDRVLHTLEVQRELDSALYYTTAGDAASRGYLLSGDESVIAEYKEAQSALDNTLARLEALTHDNPAQRARLQQLQAAVAKRVERLDETMAVMQSNGVQAAIAHARETDAAGPRAEIRMISQAMEQQEAALLQGRQAQVDAAYRQSVNGRVASSVVSAALLIGIVALALAHAHSSRKREVALIASEDVPAKPHHGSRRREPRRSRRTA